MGNLVLKNLNIFDYVPAEVLARFERLEQQKIETLKDKIPFKSLSS